MIEVTQNGAIVEVKGEVSADVLEHCRNEVIKELSSNVRIAGFRKGHAPKGLLTQHFKHSIQQRLTNKAITNIYKDTIKKYNFTPLSPLRVVEVNFKEDTLYFKGYFEVKPRLETLPEYKKIKLKVEKTEADSTSVGEFLKQLQRKNAILQPKNTQIQMGDLVNMDVKVSSERLRSGQMWLEIGQNHYIAEFDEHIIGLRCGQIKKFSLNFEDETIEFTVKIKKVYQIQLPNIDDEFAKNLGYNNLAELEAFAKDKVLQQKKLLQKKQLTTMLLDKLLESVDIPLPQTTLQTEIDYLLLGLVYNLELLGVDGVRYLHKHYEDEDKLREKIKPHAEYRLRCILLLEEIARRENIDFDEQDCERWINEYAYAYARKNNKPLPEYHKKVLAQEYKLSKTIDFLLSKIEVEEG